MDNLFIFEDLTWFWWPQRSCISKKCQTSVTRLLDIFIRTKMLQLESFFLTAWKCNILPCVGRPTVVQACMSLSQLKYKLGEGNTRINSIYYSVWNTHNWGLNKSNTMLSWFLLCIKGTPTNDNMEKPYSMFQIQVFVVLINGKI